MNCSILPSIVTGLEMNSIINAEEAVEVPPIIPLDLKMPLVTGIEVDKTNFNDRKDVFQKIAEQDFEEVVFIPNKKEKKLQNQLKNQKSLQKEVVVINHDRTNNDISDLKSGFEINSEKTLEVIEKAVQDKEKLLSNYLELDLSKYKDKNKTSSSKSNSYFANCEEQKDLPEFWYEDISSKLKKAEFNKQGKSKHKNYTPEPMTPTNSTECIKKSLETDLSDPQSRHSKSHLDEHKISEIHFNGTFFIILKIIF